MLKRCERKTLFMTTGISGQGQWGREQRVGNWLSSRKRKSTFKDTIEWFGITL